MSVGVVYSRISGTLNQALSQLGSCPYGTEKALEVNYALKVTRWFTFQPVFQYYFDTGANPVSAQQHGGGIPDHIYFVGADFNRRKS